MNRKILVGWTLVFGVLAAHHAWIIYQITTSHAIETEYNIALKSQDFCKQSVELDLIQVCEKRARWIVQPFWVNVLRLSEDYYMERLHLWFDTFIRVCFENNLCAHGTICRYNVTKIIESLTSTFYFAIPCTLVALVIWVGRRLLSERNSSVSLSPPTCPSTIWHVPAPIEWSAGIHPREKELISRYSWLLRDKRPKP
jgi:hypothetical protein